MSERERGSEALLDAMIFLSLTLGRPLARLLLYPICAYFFAFTPRTRRNARAYLRRALGREPTARDRFRQLHTFATTLLDRLYLSRGRDDLLAIEIEGEPLLRELVARRCGAFLVGAHHGTFEMVMAAGRRQPGLRIAMAMYAETASPYVRRLARSAVPGAPEIVALGHLDAMLRLQQLLDDGTFVGLLGDRTLREAPARLVPFLGKRALFPTGAMRMAAALRRQVYFMTALFRGDNRYHVVVRPIADFSHAAAGGREAAVNEAVARYAALLEELCRSDSYNWFNFYDFWHDGEASDAGGA